MRSWATQISCPHRVSDGIGPKLQRKRGGVPCAGCFSRLKASQNLSKLGPFRVNYTANTRSVSCVCLLIPGNLGKGTRSRLVASCTLTCSRCLHCKSLNYGRYDRKMERISEQWQVAKSKCSNFLVTLALSCLSKAWPTAVTLSSHVLDSTPGCPIFQTAESHHLGALCNDPGHALHETHHDAHCGRGAWAKYTTSKLAEP